MGLTSAVVRGRPDITPAPRAGLRDQLYQLLAVRYAAGVTDAGRMHCDAGCLAEALQIVAERRAE